MIAGLKNIVDSHQVAFLDAPADGSWRILSATLSDASSDYKRLYIDSEVRIMLQTSGESIFDGYIFQKHEI